MMNGKFQNLRIAMRVQCVARVPQLLLQLFFVLIPGVSFSQSDNNPGESFPGIAVIELFTSQGDINCPPADKLLSNIVADAEKNNKPVYCLSMHVDFWNRFGWKDPFSSFKYTNRLQNYTSVLGMKETYTPLMLINGINIMEGTDPKKAAALIKKELSIPSKLQPEFTYQVFDDTLDIIYNVHSEKVLGKSGSDKYINVAIVEKGLTTKVNKGDNAGKTLLNDNVTRLLFTTDLKSPESVLRIPLKSLRPASGRSIILFIQEKNSRKVIGAAAAGFVK